MPNFIHSKAMAQVESALGEKGLSVFKIDSVAAHTITEDDIKMGNKTLSPGDYCFVEVRVAVPISG